MPNETNNALQSAHHWLAETVKSMVAEGKMEDASKVLTVLCSLRKELEATYPQLKNGVAPGDLSDIEKTYAAAGQKINAIKEVRARTGLGLKEAKDLVEGWMMANNIPQKSYDGYTPPAWGK